MFRLIWAALFFSFFISTPLPADLTGLPVPWLAIVVAVGASAGRVGRHGLDMSETR